jgi:hypothetical protein
MTVDISDQDLRRERDFYRRQCDEVASQLLRLQRAHHGPLEARRSGRGGAGSRGDGDRRMAADATENRRAFLEADPCARRGRPRRRFLLADPATGAFAGMHGDGLRGGLPALRP